MAFDNYGDLKTEVAGWLQRDDLAAQIPSFIRLATADFNATLRVPQMEVLSSTTVTSEWTELPADFLGIRHIETEAGDRLSYKTPESFATYAAANANPTVPVYTIADMSFRIYPTQSSLNVELLYYAAIPEFSSDLGTNWLLAQYPNAYLAASLAWGFKYLHDKESAAAWDAAARQQILSVIKSSRPISDGASAMAVRAA